MAFSEIIVTFCFLVCLQNPVAEGGPVNSKQVAQGIDFLTKFGYLMNDDPRTGTLRSQADLEKAIKMLQRYANLPETGKMDAATIAQMGKSRCGVADYGNYNSDNTRRKKRYTLQGSSWKKTDLTYQIKSFTRDINSQETQRQIFKKSFDQWSAATNLRIKEDRYANEKDVDIHISFVNGWHNDAYPFDGQGGTLAHAFYPHNNLGLSGDAHFDDAEKFTTGTSAGINLDWVAIHEFGHALGLEHSNVRESIMYPWYKGYVPDVKLTKDDILGIQQLYGKPIHKPGPTDGPGATPAPTTTEPMLPEENDVCSIPSYDTLFMGPDKRTYALKGTQYWIIKSALGAGLESGPHKVKDLWKELPNKIDAAYALSDNRLIFFSGSKYWRYYYDSDRDTYRIEHRERVITEMGLPIDLKDMDAVFTWGRNGKTYFFKGDKYWRYYRGSIDAGYPRSIRVWGGVPANCNSVMKWRNGKTYFFKGSQYYRLDDWKIAVEANYPKSIALKWMRCEKENLALEKTTETGVVVKGVHGTRGYPCEHDHEVSSGSAVYQSASTLCLVVLAFLKQNF